VSWDRRFVEGVGQTLASSTRFRRWLRSGSGVFYGIQIGAGVQIEDQFGAILSLQRQLTVVFGDDSDRAGFAWRGIVAAGWLARSQG
jgi:hypothetical protein